MAALLLTVALSAAGIGLVMPVLPALLRELGAASGAGWQYGTFLALYAALQAVFSPLLGELADRVGRRPVLLASLAGAAVDDLVMARAPTLGLLFVGRAIASLTSLVSVAAPVAVSTIYFATRTARPGAVWLVGAALYVLCAPALPSSHSRSAVSVPSRALWPPGRPDRGRCATRAPRPSSARTRRTSPRRSCGRDLVDGQPARAPRSRSRVGLLPEGPHGWLHGGAVEVPGRVRDAVRRRRDGAARVPRRGRVARRLGGGNAPAVRAGGRLLRRDHGALRLDRRRAATRVRSILGNRMPASRLHGESCTFPRTPPPQPGPLDQTDGTMTLTDIATTLATSPAVAFPAVFAGGVLTSLTPCIYPMIPITAAIVGGQSLADPTRAGTTDGAPPSRARAVTLTLAYVLGLSLAYATLGLVAGLSGTLFGAISTNPWLYLFMANLLLAFALMMLDVLPVPVPHRALARAATLEPRGRVAGAFVMGAASGLVAAPCGAPVFAAVLTFVAATRSAALGFAYLFAFSLGMCALLVVVGLAAGGAVQLPRAGPWLLWVKRGLAALMFGAAEYYLIQMGQLVV